MRDAVLPGLLTFRAELSCRQETLAVHRHLSPTVLPFRLLPICPSARPPLSTAPCLAVLQRRPIRLGPTVNISRVMQMCRQERNILSPFPSQPGNLVYFTVIYIIGDVRRTTTVA
jgi:hypothetical protein